MNLIQWFDSAHVKYGVWTGPKLLAAGSDDDVNEKVSTAHEYILK